MNETPENSQGSRAQESIPTTDTPSPGGRRVFWLDSLQFKLAAVTLGVVLACIWGLTLYAVATQRSKLEAVQMEQQFASVQYMAADLDQKLRSRLSGMA